MPSKSHQTSIQAPALGPRRGPGAFFVFEGGEGTGKTTQIHKIKRSLEEDLQKEVIVTWEPGGTTLGQKIREMLLDPEIPKMDARCEALLFAAARAEHVAKIIAPAVAEGKIVLCDRFWDASRAYQGSGRALGFQAIDRFNEWGTRAYYPDRVYVFDLDPRKGLERASARTGGKLDRLEQESYRFHDLVRNSYLKLAEINPRRYHVVEASSSIDEIHDDIMEDMKKCLLTPNLSSNV
ncbi:dTMP kinase [bacterium]|nr:dTMP kinase [bacterium]